MDSQEAINILKQQNSKLRNELSTLSGVLDEMVKKQRQQALAKARVPQQNDLNEEEKEVRAQVQKISKLKKEIADMNKAINGNLGGHDITQLENEEKFLSLKLKQLQADNDALTKIEKQQTNALQTATNAQSYPTKMEKLDQQLLEKRQRYKELVSEVNQQENKLKKNHRKVVDMEKQFRQAAEQNRRMKQNRAPSEDITQQSLEEFKKSAQEQEESKQEEEKTLLKRLKDLDSQISDKQENISEMNQKMTEKQAESRLSALKVSEMKRIIRMSTIPRPKSLNSKADLSSEGDKSANPSTLGNSRSIHKIQKRRVVKAPRVRKVAKKSPKKEDKDPEVDPLGTPKPFEVDPGMDSTPNLSIRQESQDEIPSQDHI